MFAHVIWDPSPAIFNFNLPLLNRPLLWYGFLFALGFFVGYLVLTYLLRRHFSLDDGDRGSVKAKVAALSEQLTFYVIIGAIIGSRLGDVLFYQNWSGIACNPLSIIAVWEGGLASHGGAAGILIALWVLARRKKIPFWTAVDFTVIPTAIAAVFIRIGNFFNQEILGVPTELPWGIIFLHPADGSPALPRHPAQLYEALWYLLTFGILLWFWRRQNAASGRLTGLFLTLVFGFRFLVELVKVEQSAHFSEASLFTMGQWLSLPLIVLGLWLCLRHPQLVFDQKG